MEFWGVNNDKDLDKLLKKLRALLEGFDHGSRTPCDHLPVWATHDVLHGGFSAGGKFELRKGESNTEWLNPTGLLKLRSIVRRIRPGIGLEPLILPTLAIVSVNTCQDGALMERYPLEYRTKRLNQVNHAAKALYKEIEPYLGTLRMYPLEEELCSEDQHPVAESAVSTLNDFNGFLTEMIRDLKQREKSVVVIRTRQEVRVKLTKLLMETIKPCPGHTGPCKPCINGTKEIRIHNGVRMNVPNVQGRCGCATCGWPLQCVDRAWKEKAQEVIDEFKIQGYAPRPMTSNSHARGDSILWHAVQAKLANESFAAHVCRVRQVLANPIPVEDQSTEDVIGRIKSLEDLQRRLSFYGPGTVSCEAYERIKGDFGEALTPAGLAQLERCIPGSLENLHARGLIPSSEVLAEQVPTLVSCVCAMGGQTGQEATDIQYLCFLVRRAYAHRRSLLLFGLQSQLKLCEVPHHVALEKVLGANDINEAKLCTLAKVIRAQLEWFPDVLVPNRIVSALCGLAPSPGLIKEIAPDIFEGRFVPTYDIAFRQARKQLCGTLYAEYFGLQEVYDQYGALIDACTALVKQLYGDATSSNWIYRVNNNGKILEAQRILTTHNTARLLELGPGDIDLSRLARKTFRALCNLLVEKQLDPLQCSKMGHTWRNLVLYVSMMKPIKMAKFLAWSASLLVFDSICAESETQIWLTDAPHEDLWEIINCDPRTISTDNGRSVDFKDVWNHIQPRDGTSTAEVIVYTSNMIARLHGGAYSRRIARMIGLFWGPLYSLQCWEGQPLTTKVSSAYSEPVVGWISVGSTHPVNSSDIYNPVAQEVISTIVRTLPNINTLASAGAVAKTINPIKSAIEPAAPEAAIATFTTHVPDALGSKLAEAVLAENINPIKSAIEPAAPEAAIATPLDRIANIEVLMVNETKAGGLLERIIAMEEAVFQCAQKGTLLERLRTLERDLGC